jgi:ribosomal 50S subunit-recycling heat shock protein
VRIDQYLQKVGIVKRRSLAKQLCDSGAVKINGRGVKPAHEVTAGDTIRVKFRRKHCIYQVLQLPTGSVKKESRGEFVKLTSEELFHEDF